MREYQRKRLAVMRRQAKALERIADALERERVPEMEPVEEIDLAGAIDWKDAIRVMQATCAGAIECGPDCPMDKWCQTFNKEGSAPAKWEPVENETEAEE